MKPLHVLPMHLGWLLLWNINFIPIAEAAPATSEDRYVWTTLRLRDSGTIDNRLHQTRRIIMFKLDSATGRVWQYNPENLIVESESIKADLGFFIPIWVEGIPESVGLDPTPKPPADAKKDAAPPPPTIGRYSLLLTTMPRTVLSGIGESAGVIEREEVFLTDQKTGFNWVLDSRVEVSKKDDKEVKVSHNYFTRVFNTEEIQVIPSETKGGAKEETGYKLSKSLAEWTDLFLAHRTEKVPGPDIKISVDCAVILSRDASVLPLVVVRRSFKDTKAIAVTPWQVELYSDKALEFLCDQPSVEFEKAERFVIFVNIAGKTAKGFNGLSNQILDTLPDADRIGKVTRIQ